MTSTKILTEGAKIVRKLYDSIDDTATNIPGRKTDSISVGKERQKRAKRKKKVTEKIAGAGIVEALGIPAQTLEQKEVDSRSNVSSKMKSTARSATPPADKEFVNKKAGGYMKKMGGGYMKKMKKGGKTSKYNCSHNRLY